MPDTYRLKPFTVEAARWEPYNPTKRHELLLWLDEIEESYEELPAAHPADVRLRLVNTGVAMPGNWVVRNRDGRVFVLSAQQFAANYDPAGPPTEGTDA